MERFLLILLVLTAIFIGVTYLIHLFTKKVKFLKYIPGIITTILAIYYLYEIRKPHMGFEGIALAILMVTLAWISLTNFITGVFIDFLMPILKKMKK